jgi:predicted TIM-barrel fold metal-dependent hydrolase
LHEALVRANPEQLIWGTDWPHQQVDAAIMPNDGHLSIYSTRGRRTPQRACKFS